MPFLYTRKLFYQFLQKKYNNKITFLLFIFQDYFYKKIKWIGRTALLVYY